MYSHKNDNKYNKEDGDCVRLLSKMSEDFRLILR